MTVQLEPVVHVGAVAIGAVVECSIHHGSTPAIWFYGAKSPVAILIRRNGATTAFEIDGGEIAAKDFERRFPGQRAAFERAANERAAADQGS
jgi:hypothetical protein